MEPIVAPMGEFRVESGPVTLVCHGLGSCIGLFAADSTADIAGMAHIMLPQSFPVKAMEKEARFADIAVPNLFKAMIKAGCRKERLVFAIAGGAQLFEVGKTSKKLEVGTRNIEAVRTALKKIGGRVIAADTGGVLGRILIANCHKGTITVRTTLGSEKELCNFRNSGGSRAA